MERVRESIWLDYFTGMQNPTGVSKFSGRDLASQKPGDKIMDIACYVNNPTLDYLSHP